MVNIRYNMAAFVSMNVYDCGGNKSKVNLFRKELLTTFLPHFPELELVFPFDLIYSHIYESNIFNNISSLRKSAPTDVET